MAGLALGVVPVVVLFPLLREGGSRAETEGWRPRSVAVLTRDAAAGEVVDATLLAPLDLPEQFTHDSMVRGAEIPLVQGDRLLIPALEGDVLDWTSLASQAGEARCAVIESMRNVFETHGPPTGEAAFDCPRGTTLVEGLPASGDGTADSVRGWMRACSDSEGLSHGPYAIWNRQGGLFLRGAHVHGAATGAWEAFHPSGTVKESRHYRDGELDGAYAMNDEDGAVVTGAYSAGRRSGPWRMQDAQGSTFEVTYERGLPRGPGSLRLADGTTARGDFVGGLPAGAWTQVLADGTTRQIADIAEHAPAEDVLVSDGDLAPGEILATVRTVPVAVAGADWVRAESASYVVGEPVAIRVPKGAPILWLDFESSTFAPAAEPWLPLVERE